MSTPTQTQIVCALILERGRMVGLARTDSERMTVRHTMDAAFDAIDRLFRTPDPESRMSTPTYKQIATVVNEECDDPSDASRVLARIRKLFDSSVPVSGISGITRCPVCNEVHGVRARHTCTPVPVSQPDAADEDERALRAPLLRLFTLANAIGSGRGLGADEFYLERDTAVNKAYDELTGWAARQVTRKGKE